MAPVFITNRNRLTSTRQLVEWLRQADQVERIVILDNASTYPPLLEWYGKLQDVCVRPMPKNCGPWAFWDYKLYEEFDSQYVVTDSDIVPADCCPKDLITRLEDVLSRHQSRRKVGPGLRLDNLPDLFPGKQLTIAENQKFWPPQAQEVEPGVYSGALDSTFALHRARSGFVDQFDHLSLRTGFPYVAEHRPWYTWPLDEEEMYYLNHAEVPWSSTKIKIQQHKWT